MSIALALPTRRVEEWKYSDLARALGDAGFGEETARAVVAVVPAGMDMFDLDEPNRPDWVKAHYGKLPANAVSAVSLAKARGGIALRVPKGRVIEKSLALDIRGQGACAGAAGAGRGRGADIVGAVRRGGNAQHGHGNRARPERAVESRSPLARLAGRAGGGSRRHLGAQRGLSRPFRQFWRQAFAPRTGYRAGR